LGTQRQNTCSSGDAPTAIRKSLGATIDSTLTLDELLERLGMGFIRQRVPQNP
jgi:hypothetical protein